MAIHIQNIFISAVFKKNCVCKLTTLYNQYKAYSLHKRKHAVELQNISFFTKMHIFRATHIGGYIFLQHCSSGWGSYFFFFFDQQIGGHKNITEVLSEIYDPPIPKKMVAP